MDWTQNGSTRKDFDDFGAIRADHSYLANSTLVPTPHPPKMTPKTSQTSSGPSYHALLGEKSLRAHLCCLQAYVAEQTYCITSDSCLLSWQQQFACLLMPVADPADT